MIEQLAMDGLDAGRMEALGARVEGAAAGGFAAQLDQARDEDGRVVDERAEQRAIVREASEQLVASAFVLPMLQKIRQDPLGSDLFKGGVAEDLFGQQLDTHLADAMVGGMNSPIVDALERYMMGESIGVGADALHGRQVNVHG